MALLAAHLPFPVGDAPESEDREMALLRALEKCGTQLFPSDRVQVRGEPREEAAGLVGGQVWLDGWIGRWVCEKGRQVCGLVGRQVA